METAISPAAPGTNPFVAHPDLRHKSAADDLLAEEARTFVTFELATQWLAVDVTYVREILDRQAVTPLPKPPHDVDGVIDVRGSSVPVVDLARKLSIIPGEETAETRFLVFEFAMTDGTSKAIAVRADRVLEVSQIQDAEIERPSDCGDEWNLALISGVMRNKDHLVVLLDLEAVFPTGTTASDSDLFKFD